MGEFEKLKATLAAMVRRDRAAEHQRAQANYAAFVESARKPSPTLVKCLRATNAMAAEVQRHHASAIRESRARIKETKLAQEAAEATKPVMEVLAKAMVSDAVARGKLSGVDAVALLEKFKSGG